MSDIIITPASGKIDFYQDLGASSLAKIELTVANDLALSTTSGNLIIGDASRDIYIGNGINDVDIIFEQNGEIRPLPSKTLNIGTSGSFTQILARSLMSVNNDAGLPVFEVFSDDRVVAGRFGQNDFIMTSGGNVGIGHSLPTTKLAVSGAVSITGLLTTTSGNFISSLQLNGTNVSISGHSHTVSNITDFNSSVSGLLPTITNSGDNRVLTSTGGSVGVNAESNLTFDGSSLIVSAGGTTSNNGQLYLNGGTSNRIEFNTNGVSDSSLFNRPNGQKIRLYPSRLTATADDFSIGIGGDGLGGGGTPTRFWQTIDSTSSRFQWYAAATNIATLTGSGIFSTSRGLFSGDVTASGSFIGGSGTAALPSFEFINDPDTGMFSPATNTIGLATSGVERLRINNIGNVGIGTTAPSGQLHVIGTGIFSSGIIASNISVTGNMISATNTNGNLIIKPNASGALQADDAGNSRGIFSVDLQRSRVSVSGVANGDYSVIGGGSNNNAMGPLCTIGGGSNNTAGGDYYPGNCSTIGGGENNIAVGEKSTVGGGSSNSAGGNYSIVGGGQSNSAGGTHSTVGGGNSNSAIANKSTISGGTSNSSSGEYSIVGGGRSNSAAGYISAVCGGNSNSASGSHSTVGGGDDNTAGALASTIAGGKTNTISDFSNYSTIAGGQYNYTGNSYSSYYGLYAFVGGGYSNAIYSSYSTIGGGENNTIGGDNYGDSYVTKSVIGGGSNNTCNGFAATVGGGISNTAGGYHCTVAGGISNSASSYESTIGGGNDNTSSADHSTVTGGKNNSATATGSTVGGGRYNTASGNSDSVVCGGLSNLASGPGSTIAGGLSNTASGYASAVVGGIDALASSRGEISHATGKFADDGDAQHSIFVLRTKTTNNTPTEMGLDGASVRLTIDSGQILSGTINIIGSRSDGSAVARYLRQFTIKNVGGTTSLVGSIITLGTDEAAGTSISITADNTNDFLSIKVTGISSQTWRWVAVVDCIKTKYGT